ncbi:Major facilitator superfamily domain-containing protein 1, partial [Cichlidogyrus casuarinus]
MQKLIAKNEASLPLKEETSSSNKRPRVEDIESESDDHGEVDEDFVPDDRSLRQSDNRVKAFDLIIPAIASTTATQRTSLALINATLDQLTRDKISPPYKPVSLTTFARIYRKSGLDAAKQHLQHSQEVVCIGFDGKKNFARKNQKPSTLEETITVVKFPGSSYLTHFSALSNKSTSIATGLYNAMDQFHSLSSLKAVCADPTDVNTGAIRLLEEH